MPDRIGDLPLNPVITTLAARLAADLPRGRRALVGVDGVDGSGKTTFSAALAPALAAAAGRPVLLIHLDDFLNPSAVRHRRGRRSPEGFWLDTYDYAAFHEFILAPLGAGGDGGYRAASYDPAADAVRPAERRQAPEDAVVVVEGMFLHRDGLHGRWNFSVFLDVPFTETARRMALRDGTHPDPEHPTMRRYVQGQRLYLQAADPRSRADVVITDTDTGTDTGAARILRDRSRSFPPGAAPLSNAGSPTQGDR